MNILLGCVVDSILAQALGFRTKLEKVQANPTYWL